MFDLYFNENILIAGIFQAVVLYVCNMILIMHSISFYTYTAALPTNESGFMDSFAYYNNVRCNGTEGNLAQCLGLQPEMASRQPCSGFTAGVRCAQSKSYIMYCKYRLYMTV